MASRPEKSKQLGIHIDGTWSYRPQGLVKRSSKRTENKTENSSRAEPKQMQENTRKTRGNMKPKRHGKHDDRRTRTNMAENTETRSPNELKSPWLQGPRKEGETEGTRK